MDTGNGLNLRYGVHAESVNLGEVFRECFDAMLKEAGENPLDDEQWERIADNVLGRVDNFIEEIMEDELQCHLEGDE
jgi:hypothetical protein